MFTVSPPRIDLALTKRLSFALDELSTTGRLHFFPDNLTIHSALLAEYIHVLIDSFERSDGLMEFIDNVSGGNTRQAIEFMTDFIGSGHVDAQKIIDVYRESGSYIIPVHEFLRAITFRDHRHYDPTVSRIANLFDISSPDGREHFLAANLIAFVELSSGTSTGNEGYVDLDSVFGFGQGLAFEPAQIHSALDRCMGKKLLEANPRFGQTPVVTSVRITTIGAYSVHRLIEMFAYVDGMIVDTPIVIPAVRGGIRDVESISDRLERAETFRQYLDSQWENLRDKPHAFDWEPASRKLHEDIDRVMRRLAKDRGQTN